MPAVMMTKVMPIAMMPVSETARTMLAMLSGARNRISPCRRGEKTMPPMHHDDQADQALEADDERQRVAAPCARAAWPAGAAGGRSVIASDMAVLCRCRREDRVLVDAAGEFGDVAALAQHDDAVAEADQLRHLARGDQDAEALRRRARAAGRRFRPWRRRRRRASARRAGEAAARRGLPWRARPSAGCRPTARRPRSPGCAAGCRTGRTTGVTAAASRAADMRPFGEMRRSTDMTRLRPTAMRSIRPLPRRSSVTKATPAAARRADRAQPRRPAVDLDGALPAARAGRCRRARSAARCGRRP